LRGGDHAGDTAFCGGNNIRRAVEDHLPLTLDELLIRHFEGVGNLVGVI
jgi:hypothetical protein